MLELKKISKVYETESLKQKALKEVSLVFRQNEFVSILGPSGSGKTTLLNIIGGLDDYTTGDLIINGISTKKYKDRDWDTYRNHRVGFVFQSYNLIPHQTVFANVELALTLSGVSKKERVKRVKKVLKEVGLEEHMYKKPNQMSGGQMQRVAIARALVNDPDILLADEPTGALDSKTSSQIMDLLAEVAKNKLVIMVTHNAELSNSYSTRIINLKDGEITHDSNPLKKNEKEKEEKETNKKTSMSFKTALSLSLNNLMTKKGRTILTAFAGSIGIIGIALILSLSNGVQEYITSVEQETLSSYPLIVQKSSIEMSDFLTMMNNEEEAKFYNDDKIHANNVMSTMLHTMTAKVQTNNLLLFKDFLEKNQDLKNYTSAISYGYDLNLQLYKDSADEVIQVNPNTVMDSLGMESDYSSMFMSTDVFEEMFDNEELNKSMYELVAGAWPKAYNEIVLVVDENNQILDYTLYALGLKNSSELKDFYHKIMNGEEFKVEESSYTIDELLNLKFKLLLNTDYYVKENGRWLNKQNDEKYMLKKLADAEEIKVVGIIKPSADSTVASSMNQGGVFYTKELKEYVIDKVNNSAIVKEQKSNPEVNVLTNLKFSESKEFDFKKLSPQEQSYLNSLSPAELANFYELYNKQAGASYDDVLRELGSVDIDNPSTISIYPKDFDSKEKIVDIINDYNKEKEEQKHEEDVINYTDIVGVMMSGVSTIVNVISYVLMAFVAISLIVSSIMIGIITYISVLERTKEIGILRAIGASKKDISRVFNAETFIEGLVAGILGILVTLLLTVPVNAIIKSLAGINAAAKLPINGAIILIIISVVLTTIAGLLPARYASKKDPVEALRSE